MLEMFDALRQMTPESVLFRLALAMLFGGMIGMERGRKGRAAGFRTYMLVCLGSALTMLLGQYEYEMLRSSWAAVAEKVGPRIDVGRFGAQVINGISFLGAGTIIVTGRQDHGGVPVGLCLYGTGHRRGLLRMCAVGLPADSSGDPGAALCGELYRGERPEYEHLCGIPLAGRCG